ncbi:MAG: preprotein translocase subunit SecE [Elusimicrobiaceae bacterium]|nr:preprotein translocase subunit SecE [Elusimicrobiaceae bacterium]
MNKAIQFVKEAYSELSKATWLNRKQVFQSTIFVFMIVLFFSIYISAVDFGLSRILSAVLGGR